LTPLIGWSQLLKQKQLSTEKWSKAIEIINRNAELEAKLVDDILDASRIITGKLKIEPVEPVELTELLKGLVESWTPVAAAKRIALISCIEPSPAVCGNSKRLQQVFSNLLSNAVKFTPPSGQITVSTELGNGSVQASVSDTGMGIESDFLPHVFDRFRQEDSTLTRKYGGLGLGLAIVRHVVEKHGGSIAAESAGKGKGARFTVSLPILKQDDRRIPAA